MEEIVKYKIDITVLQEIRWLGSGEVSIDKHTILYNGREKGGRHEYGVGFCLGKEVYGAVMEFKPIDGRGYSGV